MAKKRKKLRGRVERIIKPSFPQEREKAEIEIEGADDLYREIRIENVLTDEKGNKAQLKSGEEVDLTVETKTDPETSTVPVKKPKKA
jgi:hypothetical protein